MRTCHRVILFQVVDDEYRMWLKVAPDCLQLQSAIYDFTDIVAPCVRNIVIICNLLTVF